MLKVGVLGAGHLGKIHLRLLQQSDKYELVGFYDENQENGAKIAIHTPATTLPLDIECYIALQTEIHAVLIFNPNHTGCCAKRSHFFNWLILIQKTKDKNL